MTIGQTSLFEPAPKPVVSGSMGWVSYVMFGEIAVGLCVLAVAFLGLMLLMGRLPVQHGMRVVLGCFVLLGAPVIVSGFMQLGESSPAYTPVSQVIEAQPGLGARAELPPSDYDPYAGASLRSD